MRSALGCRSGDVVSVDVVVVDVDGAGSEVSLEVDGVLYVDEGIVVLLEGVVVSLGCAVVAAPGVLPAESLVVCA